ncbi:hypothetical protein BSKO_04595 [Bryopsis sp. KO-2023]|nr:hypothetical protein BSKO_04595 [Bryopsis sp. KO-2023]
MNRHVKMLGAVAGDVIGSVYEVRGIKRSDFAPLVHPQSRCTDDSILTLAVAEAVLKQEDYGSAIQKYGRRYPHAGYGGSFKRWLAAENPQPYGSCGNGSAMRVSPIGWAFDDLDAVMEHAKLSAEVTHNHPEGIKGAQATALAIFLARTGKSKTEIANQITESFQYDLTRTLDTIRPTYEFNVLCQGSVPESIISFLESDSVEGAIRNAVSLGGDADTMAAIAGGIAQAFYRGDSEKSMSPQLVSGVREKMPEELLVVMDQFMEHFDIGMGKSTGENENGK